MSFCSRKGGATIKGKFYPAERVSTILSNKAKRIADKLERKA